ncbi:flagellar motor switch protein FliG [Piscinibacter gummiphilus]|jgi:flagellar motor switch protein FliG|uniref:Flagellar motor switch protein FliG n=1 Tax=Piscinibacter gummiphilus TaxID=946333 RepID=A0A1W6LAH0_9BURK|nr:flagellar motor switch protein G [Piscinibacter gummiphilus]ATU65964.1 flagellar motor switch protein FliG [Piscinibacter gummiphilus]GLS93846.1 flagellar motor switch protein G [Piscinibacter gummiphilus]
MPEATSKSTDLAVVSGSAMTPVEQAAIVLLSMGEEPAAAVLRCLSREELLEVTQVMSRMSGIKVEAVKTAMQRFFDDYREQSGVHGASRAYLKRSLDLALGGDIAGSVLNSIYGDAIRPKMARLQWASPKWLAEHIAHEHVRMQAVFLAFLPPALAGSVIDALPAEGRDLVLLNVARLNEIDHELLMELEELVARCLGSLGNQSANVEGIRQAAEILNRLPGDREQIVELLRAHDPNVVSEIELRMYDFFILSRQSEAVLQRIIEAVPIEQWALALKGAEPAIRNAVLQSMPRRQAQGFEDTMRRSGPVPISRIEQARAEIMAEVKALADAGEIEVQLFAEATVE